MVAPPLTGCRRRHSNTLTILDIVEESKEIFKNNELIIHELDQICAYLADGYPTLDPAPWSAQGFLHRYRFPVLFCILFFFAVIKLCFF